MARVTEPWLLLSPHGVVHTVRGEAMLRKLHREENLSYDKLAKLVGHKELGSKEKPRAQAPLCRGGSDVTRFQCTSPCLGQEFRDFFTKFAGPLSAPKFERNLRGLDISSNFSLHFGARAPST